jgi:hypothetical protein
LRKDDCTCADCSVACLEVYCGINKMVTLGH